MRKVFLTTLCATAIGFSSLTSARSQSTPVSPATNASKAQRFSKADFGPMARFKKSRIRKSVTIDDIKKDASWYKEMRDPCQVEG